MTTRTAELSPPRARPRDRSVLIGRILSGLAIAALALDAGGKLIAPGTMIATTPAPLDLPTDVGFYRLVGAILAACVALYAWPRTSVVGAILLTGFLGGAVALNARVGMPLFGNTLFGIYLGALVWGGLYLRTPALRALIGRD